MRTRFERTRREDVPTRQTTFTVPVSLPGKQAYHPGVPAVNYGISYETKKRELKESVTVSQPSIVSHSDYVNGKLVGRKAEVPKSKRQMLPVSEDIRNADGHQNIPQRVIDKGIPSAGLLASILTDKYADHLPLYRQKQRFAREEIQIAPSTLEGWTKEALIKLEPLYE